jgi:DNA-binding transcriptional ArsR family regulator
MTEIDDMFYLTTLDQVHTLADPLRVRILERLAHEPMTVKMLGTDLGETPAKVHYHVRELERIGVIRLVQTREKGGVLEKYYRAVAKNVAVRSDLLHTSSPDELTAMFQDYLELLQRGVLASLTHYNQHPDRHDPIALTSERVWATQEEFGALLKQISELVQVYKTPRGVENEQEWTTNVLGYLSVPENEPALASTQPANIRRVFSVGAVEYSRKDLETLGRQGIQVDVTVIGVCAFAKNVTPDLAERTIARIRVYGVLQASPEVRAVLERRGGGTSSP